MTAVADREGDTVVEAGGVFEDVSSTGRPAPPPTRCRVTNDRRRLLRRG